MSGWRDAAPVLGLLALCWALFVFGWWLDRDE